MRRRRGTFQRRRVIWWMHPAIFFILMLCFGTIATILALRIAGLLP